MLTDLDSRGLLDSTLVVATGEFGRTPKLNSNGGRDRKITAYFAEGGKQQEKQYKNNRPAGTWKTYFPGGKQPQTEEQYQNGRLNGPRLTYFENGQVQSRQPYVSGLVIGLRQEYYPSGKLRAESTYAHGQLSGPYRELREDGTVALTGAYRTGKQTGDWVYFKADGTTPERSVTYRNGQVYDPRARPKPVSKPRPALPKRK